MAILAGILTVRLAHSAAREMLPSSWVTVPGVVVFGMLARGGSGFWNAILAYILKSKDLKNLEIDERKELRSTRNEAKSINSDH